MIENPEQRLIHAEKALDWITKQQEVLEQKRIDYTILRANLLIGDSMPIGYYFIFKHNVLSAKVRCPKCHILGNLNIQTAKSKRRFQISHLESTRTRKCQFGYTDEFYEELEAIYEELEKKREEGVLM